MLYDPKWEQETKADPFSLASLIAWLEQQPARKTYCYVSNGECLCAQYFTAMGYQRVRVNPFEFHHAGGRESLPASFNTIAHGRGGQRTFGHALARARNLAA